MKKAKVESKPKPVEQKPTNPDRIDDKWRPPNTVTEPGEAAETYITGRKLGKGGFAVCFEGRSQASSKIFALKVVKARVEQKKMAEKFRTELQIHAKMQHPNIVDFLRAFTTDNHTYVVLELCSNGNLTDMVRARTCLSLPEVRRFMIQICGGVRYMHKRSVIHRDLKMGNIFLDERMNIKIGDFGLAAVMADEHDRRTTLCGTPNYIAPEILSKSGTRGHDNKVDTWAIGVITYAMLMGTPPFQSKTQQEIYAKLKTLEYEWKIDSKNYIPQQAKDFVAACLNLVSAERPEMDDLVEHPFFKMGVVAETLDQSSLKQKPEWLLNADPRGDKVRVGYGITQSQACIAAGVGKLQGGDPRPGVGGKCNFSTLFEIEAENQQGTAPTIPLPEGILYNTFSEAQADWARHQKYPIQPVKPRSRKPMFAADTAPASNPGVESVTQAPSLPRNVPSFAAQQRQQAVPGRTASRQIKQPAPPLSTSPPLNETGSVASTEGLLRARPVRAASTRSTRSSSTQVSRPESSRTLPKSTTLPSSLNEIAEVAAEIAPVATISKSSRAVAAQHQRPSSKLASIGENATTRPQSTQSNSSDKIEPGILRPTSGNERAGRHVSIEMKTDLASLPPQLLSLRQKQRLISSEDPWSFLPNTSATSVLAQLMDLHTTLGSRPVNETTSKSRSRRLRTHSSYPRVDKWVDYSSKHGIAYILTDGTLGLVIKSSDDNVRPSACVIVRNAKTHAILRAKGAICQLVPQGADTKDVEFYEQGDLRMDMQKCAIPARHFAVDERRFSTLTEAAHSMQASVTGSELERLKELVLLDKFGKYMNKRHEDALVEVNCENSGLSDHFIHFYQRVGNVGVWRFSGGGLQFNFPDHTKITIYIDRSSRNPEYLADLVYLEANDVNDLHRRGKLTHEALERRATMTVALNDILGDLVKSNEVETLQANEIKEKLSWIRAVIGCWIKEGGIGRMGEQRLGWSGLQEKSQQGKTKLTWVTVGRLGGDGESV